MPSALTAHAGLIATCTVSTRPLADVSMLRKSPQKKRPSATEGFAEKNAEVLLRNADKRRLLRASSPAATG